jgi:hypothetical protein
MFVVSKFSIHVEENVNSFRNNPIISFQHFHYNESPNFNHVAWKGILILPPFSIDSAQPAKYNNQNHLIKVEKSFQYISRLDGFYIWIDCYFRYPFCGLVLLMSYRWTNRNIYAFCWILSSILLLVWFRRMKFKE